MEDYVNFEQAKALKELGFDWKCLYWYHPNEDDKTKRFRMSNEMNHNFYKRGISAPTLSQAQKWLMDKKKILISIRPNDFVNDSGNTEIHYVTDIFGTSKNHLELLHSEAGYETYEFALEDGITEVLNLLNENK